MNPILFWLYVLPMICQLVIWGLYVTVDGASRVNVVGGAVSSFIPVLNLVLTIRAALYLLTMFFGEV